MHAQKIQRLFIFFFFFWPPYVTAEMKAVHGKEARQARAQLLRSLAVTFNFSCVQTVQLLGSGMFQESKDRVELIQALWQGLHDRSSYFYIVFQALTSTQQMMLGRCLGYANFIIYKVPQGRYHLRMHMLDEFAVAHRLAKMAVVGGQSVNWENFTIDGKRKFIPEDNKFWNYIRTTKNGLKMLPGEINRARLEFDFYMSGAEVCNGHILRLQARWRAFVDQRRHQKLKYTALLLQFYYRSFRAMRFMKETLSTVDGNAETELPPAADRTLFVEAVRIFTAYLLMLHRIKDNRGAQEEFRKKGLGHPLTNKETMDFFAKANRKHVEMLKRVKVGDNNTKASLSRFALLCEQKNEHAYSKKW